MATVEMTSENYEQTVRDNNIVLIDFWASWCGPCRQFGPVFEKSSDTHGDIVFAKVDTEAQADLAQSFGILSIPTLMIFREKVPVFSQPGALPESVLEDLIGQVRALDMDEVHKAIAENHAGHSHSHDHEHGHSHAHDHEQEHDHEHQH